MDAMDLCMRVVFLVIQKFGSKDWWKSLQASQLQSTQLWDEDGFEEVREKDYVHDDI